MLRSSFQPDAFGTIFGLSQRGDLHFGHLDGRSPLRGSHSWPQRHRQPSSLTIPISGCFPTSPYLSYLLILDTDGIDKCPYLDILLIYTKEQGPNHGRGIEPRQQRGLVIAATAISRSGNPLRQSFLRNLATERHGPSASPKRENFAPALTSSYGRSRANTYTPSIRPFP